MTLPKAALELVDALAAFDLDKLAARLSAAIQRDHQHGTNLADGHRTNSLASRSGTNELTPTEAAAHNRITSPPRDEHRAHVDTATRAARDAIRHLDRLAGQLTAIDQITQDGHTHDPEPGCTSCARYRDGAGRAHFTHRHRGDLCQWCYGWTNDTTNNPRRRLPPVELIERRARGERITTAIIATALRNERRARPRRGRWQPAA